MGSGAGFWESEPMVKTRRLAREVAGQALYSLDLKNDWTEQAIDDFFGYFFSDSALLGDEGIPPRELREKQYRDFSRDLVLGVALHLSQIDRIISEAAIHWNLDRMNIVDRNILRMSVYELLFCDEIPQNVTINEAIEIAKRLGTDDSSTFVNGVLDRIARLFREQPEKFAEYFPSLIQKPTGN